jgi:hypothetical protein
MLGHLFTTWAGKRESVAACRPMVEGLKLLSPADE